MSATVEALSDTRLAMAQSGSISVGSLENFEVELYSSDPTLSPYGVGTGNVLRNSVMSVDTIISAYSGAGSIEALPLLSKTQMSPIRLSSPARAANKPPMLQSLLGACLAGAVLSGIGFGWSSYRDVLQVAGALLGGVIYVCWRLRQ